MFHGFFVTLFLFLEGFRFSLKLVFIEGIRRGVRRGGLKFPFVLRQSEETLDGPRWMDCLHYSRITHENAVPAGVVTVFGFHVREAGVGCFPGGR